MPRTFVDFVTAERNEINIKDSTAESQIKALGQLQRFHNFKEFRFMTKGDILNHLDSLRNTTKEDPTRKSIGKRNKKQIQ